MGFIAKTAKSIRNFMARDKDRAGMELARGATGSVPPGGESLLDGYGGASIGEMLRLEQDLMGRYVDYEEMDDYGELASALDIMADDASQPDMQLNRTLWVTSKDKKIQKILDQDLFKRQLRVDEEIWDVARTLCKYGNDYEEIIVGEDGVMGLNCLEPPTVRRVEGQRGQLLGFVQDYAGKFNVTPDEFSRMLRERAAGTSTHNADTDRFATLEDWEVSHFRLRGKRRRSVYGFGMLEPARWIYKRLCLLEDSALVYRLQRAPERYAFYVDVGSLPPAEALAYLNRVRQQFRKKKFVNPTTGKLDFKFDPIGNDDDFFVPTRNGQDGTRIEVLGAPQWQDMNDIEYFRDKLFAAIKIPKAYLAQDQNTARAVLSAEDVRFARTILRIQRELQAGYSKVCRIHLAALGIDPHAADYDLHMTVPSSVFALAQVEVRNAQADLASRMKEFVSLHWILEKVFGYNEDDIKTIIKDRTEDIKRDTMATAGAEFNAQQEFPQPGMEFNFPGSMTGGAEGGAAPPPMESVGGRDVARLLAENRARRQRHSGQIANKPVTEQELFRGSREAEKRAASKLDTLLKNDVDLQRRLQQLGGLLQDLKQSSGKR